MAQGSTGLEQVIIKAAIAAHDIPLRIGPSLLASLESRQRDQVAGIQALLSSLKVRFKSPSLLSLTSLHGSNRRCL